MSSLSLCWWDEAEHDHGSSMSYENVSCRSKVAPIEYPETELYCFFSSFSFCSHWPTLARELPSKVLLRTASHTFGSADDEDETDDFEWSQELSSTAFCFASRVFIAFHNSQKKMNPIYRWICIFVIFTKNIFPEKKAFFSLSFARARKNSA